MGSLSSLIERTAQRAMDCGFFFDFDGTLSPIVDDPDSAVLAPGILERLTTLTSLVKRVAIVSARPVSMLADRFDDMPVRLFGLYGLESADETGRRVTEPAVEHWIPVIEELTRRAAAELPGDVLIEPKRISVALHYRRAAALRSVVEEWGSARAAELGLTAQPGRMVLELKPPILRDKGDVLRQETADLRAAWYFGDDLGDLAAFRVLEARRAVDPDFVAVLVAVANEETGSAVRALADLAVPSSEELPAYLDEVIDGIRAMARPPATPA